MFFKKDILVTFWNRYKKTKPAEKKITQGGKRSRKTLW